MSNLPANRPAGSPADRSAQQIACYKCGHRNPPGFDFCAHCGSHLNISCRYCGSLNLRALTLCQHCGKRLHRSKWFRFKRWTGHRHVKTIILQAILVALAVAFAYKVVVFIANHPAPAPTELGQ